MDDDLPEEAKLWLGAITVVSWVIFIGCHVLVEKMNRDAKQTRAAVQGVLDRDYLLPFRSGMADDERAGVR